MKKIFGFGSFSDNSVCMGIFITSFLVIFRVTYFNSFGISIENTNFEKFIFDVLVYYIRFFEPMIILILLKLVCEYLFKLLKRN